MQIHIKNLRLRTIIGIYPWEKEHKQNVIINIKITFDGEKAAGSDSIDDTLNYKTIAKKVIYHVENNHFELIESMVNQLLDLIMAADNLLIQYVHIKIDKPGALRFSDSVSISSSRSKDAI